MFVPALADNLKRLNSKSMATATKSFLGLFTYQYENDSSEYYIEVQDVRFTKDFGPWKAGDTVQFLGVDFNDCIVYELGGDDYTDHIHEVPFTVVQRA